MPNPAFEIAGPSNTVFLVAALADYAATFTIDRASVIATARDCLIDALGCGFEALRDPECAPLIGPLVPGALMPGGARVPGTSLELDPAQAAYCTGLMLCRSASGCHWAALHGGQAADPIGATLAAADYRARTATMEGRQPPKVRDLLSAIAKALEIQGVLAAGGGPEPKAIGATSIRAAEVAVTAVVTAQLGGTRRQILTALSHACFRGGMALDTEQRYDIEHGGWARADAVSRAVRYACQAMAGSSSSRLTSDDLRAADLAEELLAAKAAPAASAAKRPFGTDVMDQLGTLRTQEVVTQLTTRFRAAVDRCFPARQAERIKALFAAPERLDDLPVNELLAALVTNGSR